MRSMRRAGPFTQAHLAFVAAVGLASLAVLVAVFARRPALVASVGQAPAAFGMFLVLAFATRLMAFRIGGIGTFSVDTSVYVASVLTLGTGPSTLTVFGAMLARGLVEWVRRERAGEHWPPWVSAVKLVFGPSLMALVVLVLGLSFEPRQDFPAYVDRAVVTAIGVYAATWAGLVVPNLLVVTFSYRLNGVPWRRLWNDVMVPATVAELAFVPLGFAVAASYRGKDETALAAVAFSFVIFHYVYRRMWIKSDSLTANAAELAVVEEAGRAAASTLDVAEVGRRMGMALMTAVEQAQGVVLTVGTGPDAEHYVRAADRAHKPALIEAVQRSLEREHDPQARLRTPIAGTPLLWTGPVLNAPLASPDGGRSRGYLSIVYGPDALPSVRDQRLLASLARQAGIAVENGRLYSMATEDGLTGLYVRRYLESRLNEEFERGRRTGTPFCLMMVDVDNLKAINDLHGHAAGDDLLRAVAQAIRDAIRSMDVPARFGGDEFATLLPDMTLDEGVVVARRLTEAARRRSFLVPNGTRIEPSVSVGVAAYPESDPVDGQDLLARADAALYVVKKSGRKGSVVASRSEREPRLL